MHRVLDLYVSSTCGYQCHLLSKASEGSGCDGVPFDVLFVADPFREWYGAGSTFEQVLATTDATVGGCITRTVKNIIMSIHLWFETPMCLLLRGAKHHCQ